MNAVYWRGMSAPPRSTPNPPPEPGPIARAQNFWNRLSEGRAVEDLWSQFAADAQSSYGFYGKDVDWEEIQKLPKWKQPFPLISQFFWALMNKLTPARRVLLLLALILLLLSGVKFRFSNQFSFDINFEVISALLFLLLLSLELADKVTMKRDLEIAREIQSWLVPSEPPSVPNAAIAFYTRAQNTVAGDYYDAFYPLQDAATGGKLMLVMADVAGKSVPAALLMATLQASLRTLAASGIPLEELVHRLNQYACAHSLDGRRFTTAILGEYDPASQQLHYVNAGHNAPILRRANGGVERLVAGGLPLGILPESQFTAATVELQSGDALILFTDGVVEAFNSKGEEFTDARWVSLVRDLPEYSAQDTLNYLMQQVGTFVGATRQSDDITCLVLRCR